MDGLDLFKKLGAGVKFDFKRFREDAEKLKIIKSRDQVQKVRPVDFFGTDKSVKESPEECRNYDDEDVSDGDDITSSQSDEESGSESDDQSDDGEESPDQNSSLPEDHLHILGNIRSSGTEAESENRKHRKRKKRQKNAAQIAKMQQEKVNHYRNKNHIHVYGTDIADPVSSFDQICKDYGMHPQLLDNVKKMGYVSPTAIQMQAIPVMMTRRDLLACAPTGSGKTAAFILPILHHLKEPRNAGIRALVLAPSRELAKQIFRDFNNLSEKQGFRIHYIEKVDAVTKKWSHSSQKIDVLVTTPNRLIYMLQQEPPVISLSSVEWLVVDESDKLFEEGKTGFREQLATIYKACNSKRIRRAMFSATVASGVEEWCRLNLDNLVSVYIGARNSATKTIEQELLFVGSESGKLLAVREIIRKGVQPPVLIFVQSKERAKELFHELIYDGINVDVIHADRTQLQRDNVVRSFRLGQIWFLIATELMGRGIDFKGVNLVINYDFPNSAVSYIHRIGRTGRAGRNGRAITFFTEGDLVNLRSIANVMREAGCPVPEYMLSIQKRSKKARRKLAKSNPARETIRTLPKVDLEKAKRKREMLKKLRRKQKRHQDTGKKVES